LKLRQSDQDSCTLPCRSSVLNGAPKPPSSEAGTEIEPGVTVAVRSVASTVIGSGIASLCRMVMRTRPVNNGQNDVVHSIRPGSSVAVLMSEPAASISVAEPRHSEPAGSTRLTCPRVCFANCGVIHAAGNNVSITTAADSTAITSQGSAARRRRIQ
jgi:hypothetical protein